VCNDLFLSLWTFVGSVVRNIISSCSFLCNRHGVDKDNVFVPYTQVGRLVGGELEFDLCDRFGGVEAFRTGACAVEDRVAAIQAHFVLELLLPLGRLAIPGIGHPSVSLHERRGAEVLVLVPPVGRAGGGAAGAEDAFVEPVELLAVLLRLEDLALLR